VGVFLIVLAVVAVVAIAVVALRRADALLAGSDPPALFEVDEAIEFVASALRADVSSRLSYEDVEALLGWHLVHLAERDEAGDIADEGAVADLLRRAQADNREMTAADVRAVLTAEGEYLAAIGALEAGGGET
jgi:hypothetical protein